MDVEKVRKHFKSYNDEQLTWFKEQYKFDVEMEKIHFVFSTGQSNAQTFLNMIIDEIDFRKCNKLGGEK